MPPLKSRLCRFIERHVALRDAGEDRLQRVVILLRNGVELMRVAPRAVRRRAGERGHRLRHEVVAVHVVERARGSALRAGIERPSPEETQGRRQLWLGRVEHIRRELLADEALPRHIAVQRADDVVAVTPSVRAEDVVLEAMRVCEVNRVEPVARPALAVTRGGEQPVGELADCRLPIADLELARERLHLRRRRRQTDEIEVQPTDERARVGFGRGREFLLAKLGGDEGVDGIADRWPLTAGRSARHRRSHERLQRPPVQARAPRRLLQRLHLLHPFDQHGDFGLGQLCLPLRRHLQVRVGVARRLEE